MTTLESEYKSDIYGERGMPVPRFTFVQNSWTCSKVRHFVAGGRLRKSTRP